jgi:hypothetical protein
MKGIVLFKALRNDLAQPTLPDGYEGCLPAPVDQGFLGMEWQPRLERCPE